MQIAGQLASPSVCVVVSSHDRRFLRLIGFLISRLGYEISIVRHGEDVGEVAASLGAAVVVLDGSDSLGEMAAVAAGVERAAPDAEVIVVADADAFGNSRFRVIPKWSSLDSLGLEIEAASAGLDRAFVAHRR
jgi:hypothetical protein